MSGGYFDIQWKVQNTDHPSSSCTDRPPRSLALAWLNCFPRNRFCLNWDICVRICVGTPWVQVLWRCTPYFCSPYFCMGGIFWGEMTTNCSKKIKEIRQEVDTVETTAHAFFSHHTNETEVGMCVFLGGGLLAVYPTYYFRAQSNTFVPRGTGKFLGTFVLFSKCSDPLCGNHIIQ